MIAAPADGLPTDMGDQWPLLGLLLAVIVVLRAALELAGVATKNLTGITKVLSPKARADEEIDGRVAALKQQVEILTGTVKMLHERSTSQAEEVRIAHRLTDAQGRAINEHLAWDRRLLARVREALPDFDFPDPPDLYVFLEEPS